VDWFVHHAVPPTTFDHAAILELAAQAIA